MPLGVCAQGHAEHQGTEEADHATASASAHEPGTGAEHVHGGHTAAVASPAGSSVASDLGGTTAEPAGSHGSVPTDCVAMSGCGAPALSMAYAAELDAGELLTRRTGRLELGSPVAVDLGITTPPPRI